MPHINLADLAEQSFGTTLEQLDDRLGRLRAPDDQLFRREEFTVLALLDNAERGLLTDARHGRKRRNQAGFRHEKARCVRFVHIHRLERKSAPVKLVADLQSRHHVLFCR